MKNSWQKTTWKTFDIRSVEEQLNIIFSVLLYMMEQSLEEEICTIDDIAAYLDDICNVFSESGILLNKAMHWQFYCKRCLIG